jgi:hypothetical protein
MKSGLTNSDSPQQRAPVATESTATRQLGRQVDNCAGTAGNESTYDKLTWEEKRELMYERREA